MRGLCLINSTREKTNYLSYGRTQCNCAIVMLSLMPQVLASSSFFTSTQDINYNGKRRPMSKFPNFSCTLSLPSHDLVSSTKCNFGKYQDMALETLGRVSSKAILVTSLKVTKWNVKNESSNIEFHSSHATLQFWTSSLKNSPYRDYPYYLDMFPSYFTNDEDNGLLSCANARSSRPIFCSCS